MKNYISLIALCLFFQVSIHAQIEPCVNGFAGDYPCNDYDLLSHVTKAELSFSQTNSLANDIWGWTDPVTGKEYALVGLQNSVSIVDVTDPVNPIRLGRMDTHNGQGGSWRDIKVYNNYAFVVADGAGDHGMQVLDLTRLRGVTTPQLFPPDARYDGGIGSCHNIVINESEAIAYVVGCGRTTANARGGPIFLDISDPLNVTRVGSYSSGGYSHDSQVVTYNGPDSDYAGREIHIGSNEDEVVIVDVTNKSNPQKISGLDYAGAEYAHQGWFTDDQRYFLLGDELDEIRAGGATRTIIYDLLDLDNPVISSIYLGETNASDHNGYVKGNLFYQACYKAGLRVLDISNIGSSSNPMTEIGYFDTFPSGSNSSGTSGLWSVYPYFASGNLILSDTAGGLFVVRQSNTLSTNEFDLDQKFTVSPNPTSSNTVIKASENNKVNSIEVFNILGQSIINKKNINKSVFTLPMANYSKGVYLVKINDKVTKKLVVN